MKEVTGTARNIYYNLNDVKTVKRPEKYNTLIEAVIITAEPEWIMDVNGELIKTIKVADVRFTTSPEGFRRLAQTFNEWANEAEANIPKVAEGKEK